MRLKTRARLCAACVLGLWLTAMVLLGWDFTDGPRSEVGRLGLLVGLAAASSTTLLAMRHCRRVILEVMSWEHRMYDRGDRAQGSGRDNVRAIR